MGLLFVLFIYSVRAEWRKRIDWLLIKLYYPELVYDLFSYYMLCYIYNYSINLYSLNYWHWRLYCAEGEIAEFSSVYICKLLCNKGWFLLWGFFVCSGFFFLKSFVPAFKLHCSTSAFISAEPRSFGFPVPLETVVESQKTTTVLKPNHSCWPTAKEETYYNLLHIRDLPPSKCHFQASTTLPSTNLGASLGLMVFFSILKVLVLWKIAHNTRKPKPCGWTEAATEPPSWCATELGSILWLSTWVSRQWHCWKAEFSPLQY